MTINPKKDRERKALSFIASCESSPSTMDIAKALGVSERTARRVLAVMAEEHLVVRQDGWAIVTPK